MGTRYLLDTNIIIYYFKANIPINKINFVNDIINSDLNISIISKIEVLSWKEGIELDKIKYFLKFGNIYNLDNDTIIG